MLLAFLLACHLIDALDTAIPLDCETVSASCPADPDERLYWSACPDGDWLWVESCTGDDCAPADHGRVIREGWVDPWATCAPGDDELVGVICTGC